MRDNASTKTYYNSTIPSDWEIKSLAVLTEKVGSGITPTGGERVYKQTGRPFLRSQNNNILWSFARGTPLVHRPGLPRGGVGFRIIWDAPTGAQGTLCKMTNKPVDAAQRIQIF